MSDEQRIEAVYCRYGGVYTEECRSVDEAVSRLVDGEEHGSLSSVGVFVDGQPVLTDVWLDPHPPDSDECEWMLRCYAEVSA